MLKVVNKARRFVLNISVQPGTRDLKQYDKPGQKAAVELGKISKSSLFIFSRYTKNSPWNQEKFLGTNQFIKITKCKDKM